MMCDRDHKPIGFIGGVPVVTCDDAPDGGVMLPTADAMMTGCRSCGMPTEEGSDWCPDCWWGK